MSLKRILIHLLYWGLLLGLYMPVTHAAEDTDKPTLRIGVVYRAGDTGNRILRGVDMAVKEYEKQGGRFKVDTKPVKYLDEEDGKNKLNKIIYEQPEDNPIHVVLGPSDSGVFVDIKPTKDEENEKDPKKENVEKKISVPIVSPLVTAKVGNEESDWRFRINVDVDERARAISDYLSHASYQAIGVLYRDNEFGKRAQEAFKEQLSQPEEDYLALTYKDKAELRNQVRKIIEKRPGAVGVFGRRYELKTVKREIEALNQGWFKYRPLLFSINDTRVFKLPDTYFVTLVKPNEQPKQGDSKGGSNPQQDKEEWDEVKGLAYDTTLLILKIANEIAVNPVNKDWGTSFQKELFGFMLRPSQTNTPFKTGMEFSDGINLTPLKVLTITPAPDKEGIKEIEAKRGHSLKELWKLRDWLEIRERRYGFAIWVNLTLVVVISLWLTWADIASRQDVRSRRLYFSGPVIILAMFNVVSAAATLIIVAEMGIIRWDNVLAALGVAVAHRAMLTTTIFETAQGRALGFGRLYERILTSINERIMMNLYEKQSAAINYVTYINSVPNMKELLINIYGYAHDGADSRARIDALESEIERANGTLNKQEVCARRLLQTMNWKQLQENRIVPSYIKKDEIIDPNTILWEAVQFAMRGEQSIKTKIQGHINLAFIQLLKESKDIHDAAEKELNDALDNARTERGRLYCRLRWLFIQWGFSLRRIRNEGLLPENFRMRRGKISNLIHGKPDRWSLRKKRPSAKKAKSQHPPNHQEVKDRRQPRLCIDSAAHLMISGVEQTSAHKLDARINNVSTGGAQVLITSVVQAEVQDELYALSIQIPEGALAGVGEVEVKTVYQLSSDDGIQLGIAWYDPPTELCKRIKQLAA